MNVAITNNTDDFLHLYSGSSTYKMTSSAEIFITSPFPNKAFPDFIFFPNHPVIMAWTDYRSIIQSIYD